VLVDDRHAHPLIGEFVRRRQTTKAATNYYDVRERHYFSVTRGGIGGYRHTPQHKVTSVDLTSSEAPTNAVEQTAGDHQYREQSVTDREL